MKKNNYSEKIDNLIALCHIFGDFEEFEKKLLPVISFKYNRGFVYQLYKVSNGISKLVTRKAAEFYSENKKVIDIINKHSDVSSFICSNYGWYGTPTGDLQFFYQYILSHKDEIDKIIALLEKLKVLGFDDIDFNSELDFTQETYDIETNIYRNFNFTYLNNLIAIPEDDPHVISYKTNGSGYKITIGINSGRVWETDKKIVLNDLTFNPDELPNVISKEETYDKIIGLKEKKQKECSIVKDSVNLSIGISDLYLMYIAVSSRINQLDNDEKKEKLVELLQTIGEAILKMQTISDEYDQKVLESNPDISETSLDEQKRSYVIRRQNNEFHI